MHPREQNLTGRYQFGFDCQEIHQKAIDCPIVRGYSAGIRTLLAPIANSNRGPSLRHPISVGFRLPHSVPVRSTTHFHPRGRGKAATGGIALT